MSDLPTTGQGNLPERRLSSREVEAVIRRAVELQAHETEVERAGTEGMEETELVRMSRELGLAPRHIQQALAEISTQEPPEDGFLDRTLGQRVVRSSRSISQSAARARRALEIYFEQVEHMVPHRRFADRTVYAKASGMVADFKRMAADISGRHKRLNVNEVEAAVRPTDENTCYVSLAVDMRSKRSEAAAGGAVGGAVGGGVTAVVLGSVVAPPAALVGVPILAASLLGSRAVYRRDLQRMHDLLESVLDRLEHGELDGTPSQGLLRRLGL